MSDNNNSAGLGAFLTKFTAPIAGFIGLVNLVYGFFKLFTEKDIGLITIALLLVGFLVAVGFCLYYARFWQPEKQDKSASGFASTLSDEQVKAQAKKETRRKRVRRVAVAGLVLVPVLTLAGIGGWHYVQSLPTKDVIILVADFEARDAQNYGVNDAIQESLRNATKSYPDTKIKLLGKVIKNEGGKSGSELAREEGIKQKAAIVIWGWHNKLEDTAQISTNFEILKPPDYLPELGREVRGQVQTAAIAELKSFKVQTRLSNQMAYLTLMTLGMSRFAAKDWDGAIDRLTHALEQVKEANQNLSEADVYFTRATSYYFKGDVDRAIADISQVIKLKPDYSLAYYNRGVAYGDKRDYDKAIANYTQALKLKPDYVDAYNNRGAAYNRKKDYDKAIVDYTQALKLKPNYADVYNNRGVAYEKKKDYERAMVDLNQALKLQPDGYYIYGSRGTVYRYKGDFDRALSDYNQALKLKPDYAESHLWRGVIYSQRGEKQKAMADLKAALKGLDDPTLKQRAEEELRKLGMGSRE
ncbi:MAG: tetratricopeptide repeat protein [Lyngbya sp. HA4199-MV5]|jgi:tetratricopeptide (TPR) repeat protein|nr:tetratricopeptide repeat protein [Lyngbya sp. HA4199-MV5]